MMSELTSIDIRSGNLEAIQAFAATNDLNCQFDGATPLGLASFEGRVKVVRLMLNEGADPNYAAPNGWTPIMFAANDGRTRIVELLLKSGADPNAADVNGNTALHLLCSCPRRSAIDVARLLITNGANHLHKNNDGLTPSRAALQKRTQEIQKNHHSMVSQELINALAHGPD